MKKKVLSGLVHKHSKHVLLIALVSGLLLASVYKVNAALLEVDDAVFGSASVTSDTATGLDWVVVPESLNRTFYVIITQFGVGGDVEWWRYPTSAELCLLRRNGPTPSVQLWKTHTDSQGRRHLSKAAGDKLVNYIMLVVLIVMALKMYNKLNK